MDWSRDQWRLYTGYAIIALDIAWLGYCFAVYITLELGNTVEAIFTEYLFSFFHFFTMVTMLYLTERKKEHSTTDFRLLNLDWKNAPLIFIPLFTDTVLLVRTIRSVHPEPLLTGLSIFALVVTGLGFVWFIVWITVSEKRQVIREGYEKMDSKLWHSLKET